MRTNKRTRFCEIFFWGYGFRKTSADSFFSEFGCHKRRRRGWGGILRLLQPFSFSEIWGGQKYKSKTSNIVPLSFLYGFVQSKELHPRHPLQGLYTFWTEYRLKKSCGRVPSPTSRLGHFR